MKPLLILALALLPGVAFAKQRGQQMTLEDRVDPGTGYPIYIPEDDGPIMPPDRRLGPDFGLGISCVTYHIDPNTLWMGPLPVLVDNETGVDVGWSLVYEFGLEPGGRLVWRKRKL